MSAIIQGKTDILLMLPAMKKVEIMNMEAKQWTDDKMFQFRNDLSTGVGGKNGPIFFKWNAPHARLNSYYKAWSYKKKKHKKVKTYRKSTQKQPTVKRCLLILDL